MMVRLPSASADSSGDIMALWFDYKYGSACIGVEGDILGRVSIDNGETWLPETRLTFTQTGFLSTSFILNDTLHAAWMDEFPLDCAGPKIMYSTSADWGASWDRAEVITGPAFRGEGSPVLFYGINDADTTYHCVFESGGDLYHQRTLSEVSVEETPGNTKPTEFSLIGNSPNPFNAGTTIEYWLPTTAEVTLRVYNLSGEVIATLMNETRGAGYHRVVWDASGYSSGIYFCKLTAEGQVFTIRMALIK